MDKIKSFLRSHKLRARIVVVNKKYNVQVGGQVWEGNEKQVLAALQEAFSTENVSK